MKKLYLASVNLSGLPDFIGKPAPQIKVAFVPTAGDTYENKWFIDADRKRLTEMRLHLVEVDLNGKTENELRNLLQGVNCIYVSGGNTFYLLEKTRESGFDKVVEELLDKGVVYAGGSAGAVLVCPTIDHVAFMDHPEKAPGLKSYEGLGLVDFLIFPHFGTEKYMEKYNTTIKAYKEKGYKCITLTDKQVVTVVGKDYKVINF